MPVAWNKSSAKNKYIKVTTMKLIFCQHTLAAIHQLSVGPIIRRIPLCCIATINKVNSCGKSC